MIQVPTYGYLEYSFIKHIIKQFIQLNFNSIQYFCIPLETHIYWYIMYIIYILNNNMNMYTYLLFYFDLFIFVKNYINIILFINIVLFYTRITSKM